MLDVLVPHVRLDRTRIQTFGSEIVAHRVPKRVGVEEESKTREWPARRSRLPLQPKGSYLQAFIGIVPG